MSRSTENIPETPGGGRVIDTVINRKLEHKSDIFKYYF